MDKYTYTKIKYSFYLCRKFQKGILDVGVIALKIITSNGSENEWPS